MYEAASSGAEQHIVIMSGPAGSGRSTAIRALEDIGFEAIDERRYGAAKIAILRYRP